MPRPQAVPKASVQRAGKRVSLGNFATAEEAALAYNNAMRTEVRGMPPGEGDAARPAGGGAPAAGGAARLGSAEAMVAEEDLLLLQYEILQPSGHKAARLALAERAKGDNTHDGRP